MVGSTVKAVAATGRSLTVTGPSSTLGHDSSDYAGAKARAWGPGLRLVPGPRGNRQERGGLSMCVHVWVCKYVCTPV